MKIFVSPHITKDSKVLNETTDIRGGKCLKRDADNFILKFPFLLILSSRNNTPAEECLKYIFETRLIENQ